MLSGVATDTVTVTLGPVGSYRDELIHVLSEPPIGEEQLPPNVPLPEGEFPGGLQDRFQVVGTNPFALEHAGMVALEVEVVTSSGTYHGEGEIHTHLPCGYKASSPSLTLGGLRSCTRSGIGSVDCATSPPTLPSILSNAATVVGSLMVTLSPVWDIVHLYASQPTTLQ